MLLEPRITFSTFFIASNKNIDTETATKISESFYEIVLAPGFDDEALNILTKKKNLRLLGYFQGREAPLYGPKTIRAVRKLQRNNNIKDDGQFQTDSKMLVYNLLQIYSTPELVTR